MWILTSVILVFRTPSSCQDGKVQVRQKSMCLAAAKAGAVASCQTLACALAIMVLYAGNLKPNGTAVEGVCVTGAAIRLIVLVVTRELSRWQDGMAQYLPSRCAQAIMLSRYKEIVIR